MNISSLSFTNAISSFQQAVHHPLSRRNKQIAAVVAVALALLVAFFCALGAGCFKPLNGPGRISRGSKVHEGHFKNGLLDGKGSIVHPHMTEEGEFKEGVFDGKGKVIAKDGTVMIDGTYVKGKLTGKTKIIFLNKDTFEGEFRDGLAHGHGIFVKADGTETYDGEYHENKRHGKGKLTDKAGNTRDVEYVAGEFKIEEMPQLEGKQPETSG